METQPGKMRASGGVWGDPSFGLSWLLKEPEGVGRVREQAVETYVLSLLPFPTFLSSPDPLLV